MKTPFNAIRVRPHSLGVNVSSVVVLEIDRAKGLAAIAYPFSKDGRAWVEFKELHTKIELADVAAQAHLLAIFAQISASAVPGSPAAPQTVAEASDAK